MTIDTVCALNVTIETKQGVPAVQQELLAASKNGAASRARAQTVRRVSTSRAARQRRRLYPVRGGELAHPARLRAWRTKCPRVGHLQITVDDLPWQWADYGQSNTIILVNLPRGEHNMLIEVVDPEGRALTAQTVTFKSPGK